MGRLNLGQRSLRDPDSSKSYSRGLMGDQRNGGSDPIRLITADELGLLKGEFGAASENAGNLTTARDRIVS